MTGRYIIFETLESVSTFILRFQHSVSSFSDESAQIIAFYANIWRDNAVRSGNHQEQLDAWNIQICERENKIRQLLSTEDVAERKFDKI